MSGSIYDKIGMFIKDDNKPKVKISRVDYSSGFPEHMSIVEVFYKDGDTEKSYGYMDEREFLTKATMNGGKKRHNKHSRSKKHSRNTKHARNKRNTTLRKTKVSLKNPSLNGKRS